MQSAGTFRLRVSSYKQPPFRLGMTPAVRLRGPPMFAETFRQDLRISVSLSWQASPPFPSSSWLSASARWRPCTGGGRHLIRGFSFQRGPADQRHLHRSHHGDPSRPTGLRHGLSSAGAKSSSAAAYLTAPPSTSPRTANRAATGAYTTEDFLRILGVQPLMGRDFTAEDNQPEQRRCSS
jgi:hypothetical protein